MRATLWTAVPGYEGWYEVSNRGQVRRIRPANNASVGRLLAFGSTTHGYEIARLCREGVVRGFTVHSLVMLAFVGPRPNGLQINHKDGVKTNNALSNLEYVTAEENIAHGKRMGLFTGNGGAGGAHWSNRVHCPQGHAYAGANLYLLKKPSGAVSRQCRACHRDWQKRNRSARKAAS